MTKQTVRGVLVPVILLAVFSVIAFMIPVPKNTVFWIGYGCGAFAILFQLYIFKSSFGREDARSRFYGFPIARLGIVYLVIQLVASVAEIAVSESLPAWVAVILNVLILAAALIGCITTETMRDEIEKQDTKLKRSVSNMRELQSLADALANQGGDAELKKALRGLADEFRYSDPLTSAQTEDLEAELRSRIGDLQQAVTDGDAEGAKALCGKLLECLRERNRVCKLNK